jgi:hypothetical protein
MMAAPELARRVGPVTVGRMVGVNPDTALWQALTAAHQRGGLSDSLADRPRRHQSRGRPP